MCNLNRQRGPQPLCMLNSKRGCCALVGERISVGLKATEREAETQGREAENVCGMGMGTQRGDRSYRELMVWQ